ncbi:MAG: phenylalanine--tRNA ligase subunit beta, partial [Lachnospiraceae bacterium]|nr:phenylalanine--tRNA ligase subunit beta [Lachnospiraceae bacterium]
PILGLDDWIFDVSITANRPDCQSIFGLAREVAAVLEKPLKAPALDYTETDVKKDFKVTVEAQDICPRYTAHYVYDVKIGESPAWMKRRLALVGCNSISNMVDITNYVLKELGQPMHAFDYAYLEGDAINVRRAADGEKIVTLDEKEFELNSSNLVICDGKKPVALAGIMGGLNSEILDTTSAVMFESAKFERDNIRKSSKALGQVSDSSARFSKGVDEYTTVMAMKRALHLVEELGCGKVSSTGFDVNTGNSIEPFKLQASVAKVNGVLGIKVPDADIVRICTNLDFKPELNGDDLTLHVPAYREDMATYQDVAEEVIRMYGYDHIVPTFIPTAQVTSGGYNLRQKTELKIKNALCAQGAFEGVHYSFFSPSDLDMLRLPADAPERHAIQLINPINKDLSLMRTTLAPQMITAMARNQKNAILEGRIFEMGNKFIAKDLPLKEYPDERETIAIGVFGEGEDFFSLKGLVDAVAAALDVTFEYEAAQKTFLHPYRTAKILCDGVEIGYLGQVLYEIRDELDMRVDSYVAEIDLKALTKYYGKDRKFIPLPKFAVEKRDFCFVMDKALTCAQIENAIKESCEYITDIELFDLYEGAQLGADKKSMAFSVVFTPRDEEFTQEKIDGFVDTILKNLSDKYGAVLRA